MREYENGARQFAKVTWEEKRVWNNKKLNARLNERMRDKPSFIKI